MNNVLEFRLHTPSYREANTHKLRELPPDELADMLMSRERERDRVRESAEAALDKHVEAAQRVEYDASVLVDAILADAPDDFESIKCLAWNLRDSLSNWDTDP